MGRRRYRSLSLLLAPVLIVLRGAVEAEDPFQVNHQEGVRAFLAERDGKARQRFHDDLDGIPGTNPREAYGQTSEGQLGRIRLS